MWRARYIYQSIWSHHMDYLLDLSIEPHHVHSVFHILQWYQSTY